MLHRLKQIQSGGLIATLLRGASAALGVQIVSVGVNYLAQVLLARWLGAAEYGVLEYVTTISLVLGFGASLGLPAIVLRFVSEYRVKQDWASLRGILIGSWWQTLGAGIAVAALSTAVIGLWGSSLPHQSALIWAIWTVPCIALIRIQLETTRGMRRIAMAYAPSLVGLPLLLLLEVALWQMIYPDKPLSSAVVVALSLLAMLLVLLGQQGLVRRSLPPQLHQVQAIYAPLVWLKLALPLLLIDGSFLVLNQTDTLMLAGLQNSQAVGIYSAAFKTAGWISFILMAVNAIAAPMFAALYAEGNLAELQRLVSTIARWMFYPALAVALGLILLAEPVLLLFGPEFTAARGAMLALSLGQLVNVGCGSVGYLLTMTGHQNQCAKVVGWSALLNILLNLIGIPLLGILGAALATAISMAVWNIWMNRLVVKHLGVNPAIWAALKST
jgi:O-antigen/teichoic acid export membrane protein